MVVQTTQMRENLDAIVDALRARGFEPHRSQHHMLGYAAAAKTAQVAEQVDAMVVIGGRNSSNTTRLAEICAEHCLARTHRIGGRAARRPFRGLRLRGRDRRRLDAGGPDSGGRRLSRQAVRS